MASKRIVWDSDFGGAPPPDPADARDPQRAAGDGIVRIRRETKGRGGKTVTTILGLPLGDAELRALAKEMKTKCGGGGSVQGGVIELQGDHRDAIEALLAAKGYRTKRAGG